MERVADYIVRKIREAGAEHIFFLAGRGILYLTDALAKNKDVTPVTVYHEQGASYAAMAYARAKDSISSCLVSTGCAATNAVTACLCAYQDNLPVVFISGNNPLVENVRHTKDPRRTYGSQEADIVSIVQPITKYAVMLENVNQVAYEVEKALYLAEHGRKGPVWIDIPLDVQNMRMDENMVVQHYVSVQDCESYHDIDVEVKKVAQELNNAQRPIILIGGGARGIGREIHELVAGYNIPMVYSPVACDIYGTPNELSVGAVGSIGGSRAGNFAVQNSDYVLVIGSKLCLQLTGVKKKFARNARIVVVDIDENEHCNDKLADKLILCDARIFVRNLLNCENLERHSDNWPSKCLHWKSVFALDEEGFLKDLICKDQLDLYSLLGILFPNLPDDASIITDAGFEALIVPSAGKYKSGQCCLFPASQGAMGYAIPAIIGAYAAGRKNIVCVVGDGSIMMNIQELQIISAMNISAKIYVINNNMYAVIRKRQQDLFRRRTIGNDPSDGLPKPDFGKIAECFGIPYRRIEKRSEFMDYINSCVFSEMELVEILCTPEQKYLHESYTINENKKLVHRPIEDMSPFLPRELIRKEMIVPMWEE